MRRSPGSWSAAWMRPSSARRIVRGDPLTPICLHEGATTGGNIAIKRGDALKVPVKRLLREVERILRVPRQSLRQPGDPLALPLVQLVLRVALASSAGINEFGLDHCLHQMRGAALRKTAHRRCPRDSGLSETQRWGPVRFWDRIQISRVVRWSSRSLQRCGATKPVGVRGPPPACALHNAPWRQPNRIRARTPCPRKSRSPECPLPPQSPARLLTRFRGSGPRWGQADRMHLN